MFDVVFSAIADTEYEAAIAWYQARSPRAAAGFETAVEQSIQFLARFPEGCPLCDARHRYCAVRRYPYGLVYRWDKLQVRVIAVVHRRQVPNRWKGRD